ncbi:phosphotransferase [Candidatus Vidania fulgoroideorum]
MLKGDLSKKKLINFLLTEYKIENVFEITNINKGTENFNYMIISKNKKYVMTISKTNLRTINAYKSLITFKHSSDKLQKLVKNRKGGIFFYLNKKISFISEFIEGSEPKNVSKLDCFEIGKFISNFHKNTCKCYISNPFNLRNLTKKLKKNIESIRNSDKLHLIKIKKVILNIIEGSFYKKLVSKICHCDFFKDNVIKVEELKFIVIDFHMMSFESRLYDICVFINDWCFKKTSLNHNRLIYFLIGYFKKNKLIKKEIVLISKFILIVSYRFLVTRLIHSFKNINFKKKPSSYFKMIKYYQVRRNSFVLFLKGLFNFINEELYSKKN